jgi:hypothetical protein
LFQAGRKQPDRCSLPYSAFDSVTKIDCYSLHEQQKKNRHKAIDSRIIAAIRGHERGYVFVSTDLLDIGNHEAVDVANQPMLLPEPGRQLIGDTIAYTSRQALPCK